MAAIDNSTELVERAAAVEKVALSSKWRERPDVTKLIVRVRKNAEEQRDELTRNVDPDLLSSRWVSLRKDYLDLGAQESLPGQGIDPDTPGDDLIGQPPMHRLSHAAAAQAERDAIASVDLARMALTDAALAVLQARLARIDAGEDEPDALSQQPKIRRVMQKEITDYKANAEMKAFEREAAEEAAAAQRRNQTAGAANGPASRSGLLIGSRHDL